MNIEESIEYLKNYKYDNEVRQAIETLLTAYENLKSYNKGTKEALRVAEDLEHQANKEAGDWEARCFELEAELEKEKEKNKELEKENKQLNLVRLQYLVSSFPDTTETYKKYKKELDELLKEE